MYMKKLLKNKYFVVAVALIILGGGGFVVYKTRQNAQKQEEEKKAEEQKSENYEKGENLPEESPDAFKSQGGTTTVQSNIGVLSEASLTVYLNREETTSSDGKTIIPANSISPYFYLPSGVYSVQKLISGNWQDVATNINYPGHGGLPVPVLGPSEDNVSYRVLKTENGTAKLASKTFVVKRSDLSGGAYTYN